MTAAVLFGILGPLAIAAASWIVAERTWRREPERLTSVMIASCAGQFVFFGAYVAVLWSVVSPIPARGAWYPSKRSKKSSVFAE